MRTDNRPMGKYPRVSTLLVNKEGGKKKKKKGRGRRRNARVKKDESFGAKRIPKRSVSFERRSWLRYDVRLAAKLEGLRKRSVVEPFTNRSSSVTPQRWDVQISTGRHLPVWNLSLLSSKLFSNS